MTLRHLPTPIERARTFAAMATARHRYAVQRKLAGDQAGHDAAMVDVRKFDEKAAEERARQTVVEDQDSQRRRTATLFAAVLGLDEARGMRAADRGPGSF